MLVDIFLLILSTGVPATRLNAQFNYVSMLCHVFHVCEYTKLSHVFHAVHVWENCYCMR